jgi:hypothetical protein
MCIRPRPKPLTLLTDPHHELLFLAQAEVEVFCMFGKNCKCQQPSVERARDCGRVRKQRPSYTDHKLLDPSLAAASADRELFTIMPPNLVQNLDHLGGKSSRVEPYCRTNTTLPWLIFGFRTCISDFTSTTDGPSGVIRCALLGCGMMVSFTVVVEGILLPGVSLGRRRYVLTSY